MRSRADATPSRVLLEALGEPGDTLELSGDEAHYVTRVCRVREDEIVSATDGAGGTATLRMLSVRGAVTARVESVERAVARRRACVLCGAPEGQRADWLVEKLAELGVGRLVLVDCERARWDAAAARLDRLERLAVAGLRQSRRCWRMRVEGPVGLDEAVRALPGEGERWLADESGGPPGRAGAEGLSTGAIGPAEGFSDAESTSLRSSGFRGIALSDARLRCETAAVAWAAWWSAGGVA